MQKLMIRRSLIYLSTKLKSRINSGYIKGVKFLLKRYPKNRLAFTNSSSQKDGYGAQIQRILSVLAVSNEYNIRFILQPITFAEDQITQTPLQEFERIRELTGLNNWLRVQLKPWLAIQHGDMKIRKVSNLLGFFLQLLLNFFTSRFQSAYLLLEIEDCYAFTKIDPDIYARLHNPLARTGKITAPNREIEVHVHLRYANFSIGTERFLNPSYYITALTEITSRLLQSNRAYKIYVHADFSETSNDATRFKHQISIETLAYLESLNLLDGGKKPNHNALELALQTQRALVETFDNVNICTDEDFLSAITKMMWADYLVLSKSSFAFVAGLLNTSGHIYTPEYWNNPPSSWVKLRDTDYSS